MIKSFREANGGLFGESEKADVGTSYQEMAKNGVALMGWADPYMPDRSFPEHIRSAFIDALEDRSASHYTAPVGSSELKHVLAKRLKEFNKLEVVPDRNILITPGSDSGLYLSILPFIEKDDEVLIPSPSYPNNYTDVQIMGGKVVPILLKAEDGYQLDLKQMEEKISPKTKMVILTHPNNPTTVEGWRDLETSLVPSAMRDEVRLARLRLEYFATRDPDEARKVKKEYDEWLASLPEVQRDVMTRRPYCYGESYKDVAEINATFYRLTR